MNVADGKLRAFVAESVQAGQVEREIISNASIVENAHVLAARILKPIRHVVINTATVDAAAPRQTLAAVEHGEGKKNAKN